MECSKWTRVNKISHWDNNKTVNTWRIIMWGIHLANWSTHRELLDQLVPVLSHQIICKIAKEWVILRIHTFRKIINKRQIQSRWEVPKLEFWALARVPSTPQRRVSPVFSRWLMQGNNDQIQVVHRETWTSSLNCRIINRVCCIGRIRRCTKNRMVKAISFLARAQAQKTIMSHKHQIPTTTDTPIKQLVVPKDHKLCTISGRHRTTRITWTVKTAQKSAPLTADQEESETRLEPAERPLLAPNHEYLWEVKEPQEQDPTQQPMLETRQTRTEPLNPRNYWLKSAKSRPTIRREFKIRSIAETKTSRARPTSTHRRCSNSRTSLRRTG